MAKKIDPKAKAKQQKIYAAIGGVLLLGLLAFQVPRTLKMLHPPNTSARQPRPRPAPATATTGPIAAPSLGGGNATASRRRGADGGSATPTRLRCRSPASCSPSASSAPRIRLRSSSKLKCAAAPAARLDCPERLVGPTATLDINRAASASPSGTTEPARQPPPVRRPRPRSISVNGVRESVQAGRPVPRGRPGVHAGLGDGDHGQDRHRRRLAESGSQTVTLKKNKPVTLMNTADGTRYLLRLVSTS